MDHCDIASIQRLRLQRTSYAMGAGAALSLVIGMLYWHGEIRLDAGSLLVAMIVFWIGNLSFVAMIITNANLRLRDQTMTFAMMLWGTVSCFAWSYFASDGRHLMIMVYLLAMMLGAFRLRLAQYLQITALALTLYATVIFALLRNQPQDISLVTEGMNWFVFMLVMLGFSLLGGESRQVRDLFQRRNRELREARDAATIANQVRSRFLAGTSHELRTPLNTILGATEVIDAKTLPAQEADALQRARRAGLYLLSLVNSMIDLSQLESKTLAIRAARADLFDEMEVVREITQTRAERLGLQLNVRTNFDRPFAVELDAMRVRDVLVYLVNNSIGHTDEGTIEVTAHCIDEQSDTATVEFRVTDTGRGMTPTHIKRMFSTSPTHSASDDDNDSAPELGLRMCQELVQLMGGSINATSVLGRGSEFAFTLTFPRSETSDPVDRSTTHNDAQQDCRILIVDDAADNRMLLQVFLQNQIALVECAVDGKEAVDMFRKQPYDIVLMDMHMPRMNGIEATKAIREFEQHSGRTNSQISIIVAITADDTDHDQQRSLQAGCDLHLVKPIARATLLESLQRLRPGLQPRAE
jgi:signal transduction histidine kinase/ActR/RegA family two-component response regulator